MKKEHCPEPSRLDQGHGQHRLGADGVESRGHPADATIMIDIIDAHHTPGSKLVDDRGAEIVHPVRAADARNPAISPVTFDSDMLFAIIDLSISDAGNIKHAAQGARRSFHHCKRVGEIPQFLFQGEMKRLPLLQKHAFGCFSDCTKHALDGAPLVAKIEGIAPGMAVNRPTRPPAAPTRVCCILPGPQAPLARVRRSSR